MPAGPRHRSRSSSGSSSRSSSSSRSYSSRSSSSSRSSYSRSSRSSYRGDRGYRLSRDYDYDDYFNPPTLKPPSPRAFAIFGLVIGFIVAIACTFVGVVHITANIGYHNIIKQDVKEYAEIIENANNGVEGYYRINITDIRQWGSSTSGGNPTVYELYSNNGTPYNYNDDFYATAYSDFKKDGVDCYYLDFEFWSEEVGKTIKGMTYTYYTESQIKNMKFLSLAYTNIYDDDGVWDVIETGYQLSGNLDYWYTSTNITAGAIMIPVGILFFALMVWCSILVRRAGKKAKAPQETTTTQTVALTAQNISAFGAQSTSQYKICTYCGSRVRIDDNNCDSCGSNNFRNARDEDM